MGVHLDEQHSRRELRRRIARLRRRIDHRMGGLQRRTERLVWWPIQLLRHPGYAGLVGVLLGLAAAVGWRRGNRDGTAEPPQQDRWIRRLLARLRRELKRLHIRQGEPRPASQAEGGENGRS